MKKRLNIGNDLILYYSGLFPYKREEISSKKNIVTIGIGGNISDVRKRFNKLFLMLKGDGRFTIEATSPILKNPPFGFLEQDDFYNSVMVLRTELSPMQCLRAFQRYENRFKRKRSFKDAPRTLDIDIIFFNDIKMDTKDLTIPHMGYKFRDSVQIPLGFVLSV